MRPQPPLQKPLAQNQPSLQQPPLKMPDLPELSLESPQLKSRIEDLPEFTSKTLQRLEAKPLGVPAKPVKVDEVSEPVLDYDDTDELRRAILHYEILGKPLSVRDPSEKTRGF